MSKDIFTEYFYKNTWRGKESVSGPGSDYEQTKFLIPELGNLIRELKVKTIFDAPCGDFNWMRRVNLNGAKYTGGDIVEPLIKQNKRTFKNKNLSFINFDLVTDKMPTVDLVIIRDCLVHLPNSDVLKVLNNVRNSKSKYLLTTHFTWETQDCNKDIKPGQWRRLNLTKEPFNFIFPSYVIIEGNIQSNDRDKTLSLWKVEDITEYEETNG